MMEYRWLRRRASRKHQEHWKKLPTWYLSHRQHCSYAIYSHSTWSPQRRIQPSSFHCRWTSYALSLTSDDTSTARHVTSRHVTSCHVIKPTVITDDAADDDDELDGGGDDEGDAGASFSPTTMTQSFPHYSSILSSPLPSPPLLTEVRGYNSWKNFLIKILVGEF